MDIAMLSSVVSVSESESDEEPNINTVNKNCEEEGREKQFTISIFV